MPSLLPTIARHLRVPRGLLGGMVCLRQYSNLDLLIYRRDGGYTVRVSSSPVDPASAEFSSPLENPVIKSWMEGQAPPRRSIRDVGVELFNCLFGAPATFACLRASLPAARSRGGVRLRFFLDQVPELSPLPWEALWAPAFKRHLALRESVSLVRYPELPEAIAPLRVDGPLQILVVSANLQDRLDVPAELARVHAGFSARGIVPHVLEHATLESLEEVLRKGRYHILHFIGHGDTAGKGGELVFEDGYRRPKTVDSHRLGTLLGEHPSLRLAVLNACGSAWAPAREPWSGVAQALLAHGVPAVVAMPGPVTDSAAIRFAQGFYRSLGSCGQLDAATAAGRKAMYVHTNDYEWASPILWLRSDDGRIFIVRTPWLTWLWVLIAFLGLIFFARDWVDRPVSCDGARMEGIEMTLPSGVRHFPPGVSRIEPAALAGLSQVSGHALFSKPLSAEHCTCRWWVRFDGGDLAVAPGEGCRFDLKLPEEFSSILLQLDVNGEPRELFRFEREE